MNFKRFLNITAALALGAFTLQSCDEGLAVTLANQTIELDVEVKSTTDTGSITFANDTLAFNLQAEIDSAGLEYDVANIQSIKLNGVSIVINDDSSMVQNFDALSHVSANFATTTQPNIEIANLPTVPNGLDSLFLNLGQTELLDYLKSDTLFFSLSGGNDQPIIDDVKVKAIIDYDITVLPNVE